MQSYADYSLFTYYVGDIYLCLLIYVDDLLITGNSLPTVNKFKTSLSTTLLMKDLGTLKYFLGTEVARNIDGINLCQQKYIPKIVYEVGLIGDKPVSTPIEPNHKLAHSESPFFAMPDQYGKLIGKLIYLTVTRSKLTYVIHILPQLCNLLILITAMLLYA